MMTLGRAAAAIGSTSMISRFAGFARDALIAALFGAGPLADALVAALAIPNLIRRAVGEGALNAAFTPIFARRRHERGKASARRFSAAALKAALPVMLLLAGAIAVFAGPLIMLIASGFAPGGDQLLQAGELLRIMAPAIALTGIMAALAAALNAEARVGAAAVAAMLFNVFLVLALVGMEIADAPPTFASARIFAFAVSAAALLQLGVLAAASRRFTWRLMLMPADWTAPDARAFASRMWPGLIVSAMPHLALLAGLQTLSAHGAALAPLYYADRLFQLPLGVMSAVIGIALLPVISGQLQAGERAAALEGGKRVIALSLALTLPAAVAFWMLSDVITAVLFERGAFTRQDTLSTAMFLKVLGLGLPAAGLSRMLLAYAWAREGAWLPLWICLAALAGGFAAARMLADTGPAAAALAITVANVLFAGGLALMLWRQGLKLADAPLLAVCAALAVCCLVMAAALHAMLPLAAGWLQSGSSALKAAALVMLCLAGAAVFGLALLMARAIAPGPLRRLFAISALPREAGLS